MGSINVQAEVGCVEIWKFLVEIFFENFFWEIFERFF